MRTMTYGSALTEHLPDVFPDQWAREMIRYMSFHQELLIGIVAGLFLLSVLCTRKQNWILLALYGAGMIYLTVLSREAGSRWVSLSPFWSYRLVPISPYFQRQVINNILLFVPVGTLLFRIRPKWNTLFSPFFVSLVVEVLQYLTGRGLFEIDDLISNTIGGLIGCAAVFVWESARQMIRGIEK